MKQPKISVVVPIYNAEKFLHSCVDSILSQTFKDFELLLVDDGSPDNSGAICDEYAKTDSRIRVFHIPNSGANRAREWGVNKACNSEYITFVDSDDSLPPTALQDLYALTSDKYDIIIGSYDRNPKQYIDEEIDKLELVRRIYHYDIASSPYAKLFRKELFDKNTFDLPRDFVMGEDFIMNLKLAFSCKKAIRTTPMVVYHYNDNAGGITNTFDYTLDYLNRSYHFKKQAIPNCYRKECMPCCIGNILQANHIIVRHYSAFNQWDRTPLHRQVLEDIHTYGCKELWWERFSLNFSNPIFSRLYLWIRAVVTMLKKIKRSLISI